MELDESLTLEDTYLYAKNFVLWIKFETKRQAFIILLDTLEKFHEHLDLKNPHNAA